MRKISLGGAASIKEFPGMLRGYRSHESAPKSLRSGAELNTTVVIKWSTQELVHSCAFYFANVCNSASLSTRWCAASDATSWHHVGTALAAIVSGGPCASLQAVQICLSFTIQFVDRTLNSRKTVVPNSLEPAPAGPVLQIMFVLHIMRAAAGSASGWCSTMQPCLIAAERSRFRD
jgi:hypothetical protein